MTRWLLLALVCFGCSQQPEQPAALSPDPNHEADLELDRVYGAAREGDEQALQDLLARAQASEPRAQNLLGNYYSETFPYDEEKLAEAFRMYLAAAKQGLVVAQLAVSHFYLHGRSVDRDPGTGLAWLQIAAEQGEPLSLFNLGNAYRAPEIAAQEQNLVQTYKWWTIMIGQLEDGKFRTFGDSEVAKQTMLERCERLAEQMTPEQIAEAESSAQEWAPKSWAELQARMPL